MASRPGRLTGVWRHRVLTFYRERAGEPFTARELSERFGLDPAEQHQRAHIQLRLMRLRGDVVMLSREPNRYAPVLR